MDELERWRQPDRWHNPGKVAITSRSPVRGNDATMNALQGAGLDVTVAPLRDEQGGISAAVREADVVISGGQRLGTAEFGEMAQCRLLLRPYVGFDDIDVDAATANGILMANVPDAFSEEVAIHAVALILAFNRALFPMDRYVRSGQWGQRRTRADLEIRRPSAQTVGIVGFGVIGRMVAERLRPFGYQLLASDPFITADAAEQYGARLVSLEELLAQSDVVTLHVLLTDSTRHLMNAERLAQMKQAAVLVNTCRGPVVDEAALVDALRSGHLRGAALDVFEQEPIGADHPLVGMEQVILTPHAASQSVEGQATLRRRVAEIASSVALGRLPERKVVVNKALFDRVAALPELAGVARS